MDLDRNINNDSYINDIRKINDFKTITFSKFNKNEVKKTFLSELSNGRIENSCNWCAELICSGHIIDVWELILFYLGKNIYLGNPKLIFYLESRWEFYKSIFTDSLEIRNDDRIRKLFAEIICVLSLSKHRQCIESVKISSLNDFNLSYISSKLKAPTTEYLESIFQKGDPKCFYIAINEFCYSISKSVRDIKKACYWIEWILEFDIICRRKKTNGEFTCKRRDYIPLLAKYQEDIVWIIWDAIIFYGKEKSSFLQGMIKSLLHLFCIHYTSSLCKKRRYLLFLATGIIIDRIEIDVDLIQEENKDTILHVVNQIDDVYKEINKNQNNK